MTTPTIEEVSVEYEKNLFIPSSKPSTQFVLCPVGPVGAGKTTL